MKTIQDIRKELAEAGPNKMGEILFLDRQALLNRPEIPAPDSAAQELYLRFLAMPRSGSHAVINWIASQFKTACYVEERLKREFDVRDCESSALPCFKRGVAKRSAAQNKELMIHGFEWRPTAYVFNPYTVDMEIRGCGGWNRKMNVLVLRDPYNLAASMRVKRTDNNWRPLGHVGMAVSFVRHWIDHAVWFLDHQNDPDCLCINYNRWFSSVKYRRELCEKLGVPHTDKGLNEVSDYAKGSSFDGTSMDGKAQEMKVDERWKQVETDPLYLWMFARWPELAEMSRIIFGKSPAEEAVFSK